MRISLAGCGLVVLGLLMVTTPFGLGGSVGIGLVVAGALVGLAGIAWAVTASGLRARARLAGVVLGALPVAFLVYGLWALSHLE